MIRRPAVGCQKDQVPHHHQLPADLAQAPIQLPTTSRSVVQSMLINRIVKNVVEPCLFLCHARKFIYAKEAIVNAPPTETSTEVRHGRHVRVQELNVQLDEGSLIRYRFRTACRLPLSSRTRSDMRAMFNCHPNVSAE